MKILQDAIPTPRMVCDHTDFRCLADVRRAPIIVIPAKPPFDKHKNYRPIRIPTPLHYCEFHRGGFDVHAYLTDAQKRRVELAARQIRPHLWQPDFDAAFADLVLVTTPEYRRFLVHIGMTPAVARHAE